MKNTTKGASTQRGKVILKKHSYIQTSLSSMQSSNHASIKQMFHENVHEDFRENAGS